MKKLIKIVKRTFLILLALLGILTVCGCIFLQHPKFGKGPSGERLARIEKSPNFKDGKFQNINPTPTFAPGYTFWGQIKKQIFEETPRKIPVDLIPSKKTDLLHLDPKEDIIIWFGHSSCFIQLAGKKILIDPVLNTNASPIPGTVKSFAGTNVYAASDIPEIDYLLISHDHYDHLDYETILALEPKIKHVICGLGVGAHFEYWGYPLSKLIEKDWHEKEIIGKDFTIFVEPAHHKSGRSLKQNKTLWASYVIQAPTHTLYYSGDGGYDTHFAEIGKKFGPIDMAIMEDGQYDKAWRYVHLLPDQVVQATIDLKAKRIFPVHCAKFTLAKHPWDEPLEKVTQISKEHHIPVATPLIGEAIYLKDTSQIFSQWWKTIQ